MKNIIIEFFTWWNGQTLGTRFFTWLRGERVGTDDSGNVYYKSHSGKRWVIYSGEADASCVPPGWHGWLHYRIDVPPSSSSYEPHFWERPHRPNETGSSGAYRPPGANLSRPEVSGDYDSWTPD